MVFSIDQGGIEAEKLLSPYLLQKIVKFIEISQIMETESKNLQKYFENDPPSFFDELAVKDGEEQSRLHSKSFSLNIFFILLEEPLKVSAEVRDLWPHPDRNDRQAPTAPYVSVDMLVSGGKISKTRQKNKKISQLSGRPDYQVHNSPLPFRHIKAETSSH